VTDIPAVIVVLAGEKKQRVELKAQTPSPLMAT
jgi:hypothetical protein